MNKIYAGCIATLIFLYLLLFGHIAPLLSQNCMMQSNTDSSLLFSHRQKQIREALREE